MDFELIYRQNYRRIFGFCFRMLGHEETARDITQEVFLKLYELKNKGHEPDHMLGWLYRVSGNHCLNHLKRTKNTREKLVSMGIPGTDHNNPETHYIKNETRKMIRHIVDRLEPQQRLLLLGYQDGLSYKELSVATGIAYNSIGKILWRTIELVSRKIKDQDHG